MYTTVNDILLQMVFKHYTICIADASWWFWCIFQKKSKWVLGHSRNLKCKMWFKYVNIFIEFIHYRQKESKIDSIYFFALFMVKILQLHYRKLYFLLCNKKSRCDFDDKLKVGDFRYKHLTQITIKVRTTLLTFTIWNGTFLKNEPFMSYQRFKKGGRV